MTVLAAPAPGEAVAASAFGWEMVEEELKTKIGDSYDAWRTIAMQEVDQTAEVSAVMIEIAGDKGWLKEWMKSCMKSPEYERKTSSAAA